MNEINSLIIEEPEKILALRKNRKNTEMMLVYQSRLYQLIDIDNLSILQEGRLEGSGGLHPPLLLQDDSFAVS